MSEPIIIYPSPAYFLARSSFSLLPSPPGAISCFYPGSVSVGHEVALGFCLTYDSTRHHLLLKAAQQSILGFTLTYRYFYRHNTPIKRNSGTSCPEKFIE
jgi:hypothetical protein